MIGSTWLVGDVPIQLMEGACEMATGLSNLGSLSQAAREKQLKVARGILLVIGVLSIIANLFFFTLAESNVNEAINQEVAKLHQQGMTENPAEVAKIRDNAVALTRLINGVGVLLGAIFVACGITVRKYPVPITILSLVLYIGAAAVFGYINPASLLSGLIMKIIIIVALAKSVQSAIAYEREKSLASAAPPIAPLA
jgi:hypothetical protein